MTRTKSIIAVFGSTGSDTIGDANLLGQALAERGCIVLTGGGKNLDADTVKDAALRGARRAENDHDRSPCVGVLGREAPDVFFRKHDQWSSLALIGLGYGDRRNYVEASMCDAAAAFPGGEGTKSEVGFALALGRPVILIGETWGAGFPAVADAPAFETFVKQARHRAHAVGRDAIDRLIDMAYGRLRSDATYDVEFWPLHSAAADVAERLRLKATNAERQGHFPPLPERDGVRASYEAWLAASHESPTGPP